MEAAATGDRLLQASDYAGAVEAFTQALAEHPDAPSYYLRRSTAYHKGKNYEAALLDCDSAIKFAVLRKNKTIRTTALFRKGLVLYCLCDYEQANFHLRQAQQDGCLDKSLPIWLEKLKQLGYDSPDNTSRSEKLKMHEVAATLPLGEKPSTASTAQTACHDSLRHDWYQSPCQVILNIYIRQVTAGDCQLIFNSDSLDIDLSLPNDKHFRRHFGPFPEVILPEQSSYRILSSKLEITMQKSSSKTWGSLEGSVAPKSVTEYPTSSRSQSKNWDVLDHDNEELTQEGDAALQNLFQNLYRDADEDTKKAMIKSYTESGGTSLSTDWNSVKQGKVKIQAPDGMEARKFE